ncbi:MAG TPA: glycosyltransferase [Anaerolineales bacterium]|nr:glycosyltransferase [Anaerolineales bacterium]
MILDLNPDAGRTTVSRIVLFVADSWEHVCPVVRVSAPAREAGLTVIRGNELQDGRMRFFPERISEGDLVVIQRDFPAYEDAYERVMVEARARAKPVVYELDDLLLRLPDVHPDRSRYERTRFPIMRAILEADAVIAPSATLCEFLSEFNPSTWLYPNYLVDAYWTLPASAGARNNASVRPLVVGYMGGHSHSPDIAMIAPVLLHLLERYREKISLRFWGLAPPPELSTWPNVEAIHPGLVDYEEFARYFGRQECDIFVAPLLDNMFNRCKSALKFLEYSSLGVPGVYSRVAPYESVVRQGENGFLASNEHEWETQLSLLIEDAGLRSRVGTQAQLTVRDNWLLSEHGGEWADTLAKIASVQKSARSTTAVISTLKEVRSWYEGLVEGIERDQPGPGHLRAQLGEDKGSVKDLEERLVALQTQVRVQEEVETDLRHSLVERDQTVGALQAKVAAGERETQELSARLNAITSGRVWQFALALRAFEMSLMPKGSLRERICGVGMRSLSLIRAHGISHLIRVAGEKLVKGVSGRAIRPHLSGAASDARERPMVSMTAEPGAICPAPAIAIVVIHDGSEAFTAKEAQHWREGQTWRETELVIWSRRSGQAWRDNARQDTWRADDVSALCGGIRARYMCVASPDLLEQEATFLEANLIALETESLAFTVNVFGNEKWAPERLRQGHLPGDRVSPLLRQVVRRDCVGDGFSLDVSSRIVKGKSVIGKLIVHTTDRFDGEGALAFEARIHGAEIVVAGQRILGFSAAAPEREAVSHLTHPVDTVLAVDPQPGDLPTVLVILPFLAVGGAERLLLRVMRHLKDRIRFLVLTVDRHDPALGTTADEFRQVTPYVYNLYDFLESHLLFSFFSYAIGRFAPGTFYIANGATWIYDAISTLRAYHPSIRMIDQVYHHQLGWIDRYDPAVISSLDGHIGGNSKICRAYVERGARTGQVYLIEHGVEPDEVDPALYSREKLNEIREKLDIKGGRRIVSFVGRLHPQKRPLDFVELARRFSTDSSLVFLMIGGGPLMETVSSQISRVGLTNLSCHSYYRPISDIYAVSDVIVIPSEYEATPLVLLEAQAMGKPVVATDVGNNREVLEFTKGGQVASRVGDVDELAGALTRALSQPYDPVRMRQAVIGRFGMGSIAEQYRRVLLGE